MIGFGQTLIPDANFEQALINLGYDTGTPNGSVPTANIDTVTYLNVGGQFVSDLTGIEAFTALTKLDCGSNQLSSLDVSQNTALTALHCEWNALTSLDISGATALDTLSCQQNQLTSLDVSQNTALEGLNCYNNQLTSLDVSNNTALTHLSCSAFQTATGNITSLDVSGATALEWLSCFNNQLTTLDVSNNTALAGLQCYDNQLTSLDIRNGNNSNMNSFHVTNNPNLTCVNVDDAVWSTATWTVLYNNIDPQHYFSNNCSGTGIEEYTTKKELLRTIDVLGRETKHEPLFYIYDDGTVEKRITID